MLVMMMMLALGTPNPHSLDAPRKAFSACIRAFETKSLAAKMDYNSYAAALKTSCINEATALANALTAYDVAMGTKRASAEATAASDVEDYRATSEERFRELMTPAKGN
jgi:hypothetical protein